MELVLVSFDGKALEDSLGLKLGAVDKGRVEEGACGLVLEGPPLGGDARV